MKRFIVILISIITLTGLQVTAQESGKKDSLIYLQPKEQYPIEMQYVLSLLNRYHYRKAPLNDSVSAKIFDNYITALDPSRLYFLDSDIAYFQRYKNKIDDDIRKGKLNFAYQLYHVRRERALNRINFLLTSLDNELDFSVKDNYYFDRSEAEYAKGKSEWDALWLQYLKSQAIRYKLLGKEWDEISTSLKKRYNISKKGIFQGKTEDVFETYMNAMTTVFDPHTNYFAPKNADDFNIKMSLSLEGIGARLRQNLDYTEIMEVVVGGPAYKSKEVKEKDKIVGVGQDGEEIVDVVGWRIDDVVQLIRGKKGTKVTLLLSRADKSITDVPDTVTLVRDKINLEDEASTGEIIPIAQNGDLFKLGVITIPKFYRNFREASAGVQDFKSTTRDVRKIIDSLREEGMDALMIDLRYNGGGSLAEAVELTGLFIKDGPVVQVRNYDNTVDDMLDTDTELFYDGPLAVMINRVSASASEIVSGAIQDYERGIILGQTTFGKGSVQNLISLDQMIQDPSNKFGQLKITLAKFYRVTGSSNQHIGVTPDIQFPAIIDDKIYGESTEESALPWDKIASMDFSPTGMVSRENLKQLNKIYQTDLENDPLLKKLVEDIKKANENRDKTYVSLNYDERKQEMDANKEKEDPLATSISSELKDTGNEYDINDNEKLKDDPYLKEGLKLLIELTKMKVG